MVRFVRVNENVWVAVDYVEVVAQNPNGVQVGGEWFPSNRPVDELLEELER